jgi:hypothetical protein
MPSRPVDTGYVRSWFTVGGMVLACGLARPAPVHA